MEVSGMKLSNQLGGNVGPLALEDLRGGGSQSELVRENFLLRKEL